jgi:hypothetical protein
VCQQVFRHTYVPVGGCPNILDEEVESANPQLPLLFRQRHDGQGLEVEVGPVEDDEAPAGLDVLRVVRPLHEVARIFSGPEKIDSGQSVKRDPF